MGWNMLHMGLIVVGGHKIKKSGPESRGRNLHKQVVHQFLGKDATTWPISTTFDP